MKIGFQGIIGAYSHEATMRIYPQCEAQSMQEFQNVIDGISSEEIKYGVLPVENSTAGPVYGMHRIIKSTNLHIVGEYFHKVEHHLLALKDTQLESIKEAYSHPQALAQCRKYLLSHDIQPIPVYDTAYAALYVAQQNDPSKASISSKLSSDIYNLKILDSHIHDEDDNTTIFKVFSKHREIPIKQDHLITSFTFKVINKSGSLNTVLDILHKNHVNMIKLESYIPCGKTSSQASFMVSIQGQMTEITEDTIRQCTISMHVLGTYPSGM